MRRARLWSRSSCLFQRWIFLPPQELNGSEIPVLLFQRSLPPRGRQARPFLHEALHSRVRSRPARDFRSRQHSCGYSARFFLRIGKLGYQLLKLLLQFSIAPLFALQLRLRRGQLGRNFVVTRCGFLAISTHFGHLVCQTAIFRLASTYLDTQSIGQSLKRAIVALHPFQFRLEDFRLFQRRVARCLSIFGHPLVLRQLLLNICLASFEERNTFQFFILPGERHLLFRSLVTFELQQLFLPANRDGVFGAQPVPVSTYFGQRYRQFGLNLPARQKKARRQTDGPSRITTKTATRTPNMKRERTGSRFQTGPSGFRQALTIHSAQLTVFPASKTITG